MSAVTVYEALSEGTRKARGMKYDRDKAQAMLEVGDLWPYMTPDEMRRYRQGVCRELAILALDTALRLTDHGTFALMIGDTNADTNPDHAWCEGRTGDECWWADPTNEDEAHRPGWFSRLIPQRVYAVRLNENGNLVVVGREDVRR